MAVSAAACGTIRAVLHILLVTFPFFALVLCGYLAARRGMLPLEAIPGLNTFVLYLRAALHAVPLRREHADRAAARRAAWSRSTCCARWSWWRSPWRSRLQPRIGWNDASFGALVAAFPNTGFMGVPLLVALLGAQAAGPAIVTIVVDMVVTSSLCIALSRLDGADEHGAAEAAAARRSRAWRSTPCPGPSCWARWPRPAAASCPARCCRRWACWPMPPRRWRCSPSARCWRVRRCGGAGRPPDAAGATTCRWR